MSKNKTTSAELTAKADALAEQLKKLRSEARKMEKLEEQKAKEEQRKRDVAFALEFVSFSKTLYFKDSQTSYFDYISKKMKVRSEEEKSTDHVSSGNGNS